jgi:hypothetical protein
VLTLILKLVIRFLNVCLHWPSTRRGINMDRNGKRTGTFRAEKKRKHPFLTHLNQKVSARSREGKRNKKTCYQRPSHNQAPDLCQVSPPLPSSLPHHTCHTRQMHMRRIGHPHTSCVAATQPPCTQRPESFAS